MVRPTAGRERSTYRPGVRRGADAHLLSAPARQACSEMKDTAAGCRTRRGADAHLLSAPARQAYGKMTIASTMTAAQNFGGHIGIDENIEGLVFF